MLTAGIHVLYLGLVKALSGITHYILPMHQSVGVLHTAHKNYSQTCQLIQNLITLLDILAIQKIW